MVAQTGDTHLVETLPALSVSDLDDMRVTLFTYLDPSNADYAGESSPQT